MSFGCNLHMPGTVGFLVDRITMSPIEKVWSLDQTSTDGLDACGHKNVFELFKHHA